MRLKTTNCRCYVSLIKSATRSVRVRKSSSSKTFSNKLLQFSSKCPGRNWKLVNLSKLRRMSSSLQISSYLPRVSRKASASWRQRIWTVRLIWRIRTHLKALMSTQTMSNAQKILKVRLLAKSPTIKSTSLKASSKLQMVRRFPCLVTICSWEVQVLGTRIGSSESSPTQVPTPGLCATPWPPSRKSPTSKKWLRRQSLSFSALCALCALSLLLGPLFGTKWRSRALPCTCTGLRTS